MDSEVDTESLLNGTQSPTPRSSIRDQVRRNRSTSPSDISKWTTSRTQASSIWSSTKQWFPIWARDWWLEILACIVSSTALVATVIVLAKYNRQSIYSWPLLISINALVSVLSVVMRFSMVMPVTESLSQLKWTWFRRPRTLADIVRFDDASRGLWGCVAMVIRTNGPRLASLAAFAILLSAAVDPFVQQVVKLTNCKIDLSSERPMFTIELPQINRCGMYNTIGDSITNGTNGSYVDILEAPMQAAISMGVWGTYNNISASCQSGNCTFPEYRTLAMCSACQNVTNLLKSIEVENSAGDLVNEWRLPGSAVNFTNGTGTIVALDTRSRHSAIHADIIRSDIIIDVAGGISYENYEKRFRPRLVAFQCSLWPCVRTYNATVTKGTTTENLLSTQNLTESKITDLLRGMIIMPCIVNGTKYEASYFTQKSETNWIDAHGLLPNNQTAWLPNDCVFSYNMAAVTPFLERHLTGSWRAIHGDVNDANPSWLYSWDNGWDSRFHYDTLGMVNATWTAIAGSMSTKLRILGGASPLFATGSMWQLEPCINVQWAWLIYPIVILLASIALLAVTVVHSNRHTPRRIWKASPIAVLAHGLDDHLREEMRKLTRIGELHQRASELHAQLVETETGVELSSRPGPYSTSAMIPSMLELVRSPQPISRRRYSMTPQSDPRESAEKWMR